MIDEHLSCMENIMVQRKLSKNISLLDHSKQRLTEKLLNLSIICIFIFIFANNSWASSHVTKLPITHLFQKGVLIVLVVLGAIQKPIYDY